MKRLLLSALAIVCALSAYAEGGIGRGVGSRERLSKSEEPVRENFAIHYRVNATSVDENFMDNKAQIHKIKHYLVNSPRVDSITIYAWSSPDGLYSKNKTLSRKRANSAKKLLLQHSPDSAKLNSGKIKISPIAENWDGLIELVEKGYDRKDREKVLSILNDGKMGSDRKKRELKKLDNGRTWKYLADNYLPQLRAATWVCVWAEVIQDMPEVAAVVQDRPVQQDCGIAPLPPYDYRPKLPQEEWRTVAAVKTNLLYDAVTAINFAVEAPFEIKGQKFSALYEHHCPWWHVGNKFCLQFLTFGGEARWWFLPDTVEESEKRIERDALLGHFAGLYAWGGLGDIQIGRNFGCSQFDFWSVGLTYGYAMPISKYLNLEFSLSVGYANIPYQSYRPSDDWEALIRDPYKAGTLHYFGPTKAEVSLVFPIRTKTKGGEAR